MLCRSLFVLFLLVIVLSVLLQTLLQFYRGGRVPLVEQKLLTLSEHISTPGFKWGSRYSIFSFMFNVCRSLFVLLYFFFWPLCVCPSSIYGLWLPPFGIFKFLTHLLFGYYKSSWNTHLKMPTFLECLKKSFFF